MTTPAARRLAAIAVADVVGYSRLMELDEAGTLAALKQRRKAILEPVVRAHGGRIVKVMGDGVLIEFASAVNAVEAAIELQAKFNESNNALPENRRIILRIGINLGDVIGEATDIYGDGVNIAARLETIAEPGAIALSGAIYEQVQGKIDAAFEDIGAQTLRNISQPIRVWRLGPGTAAPASKKTDDGSVARIAVLSFNNMSGIPEQEYISDGISENIITDLSRFRDLTVIARNSSFTYKGKALRIPEISRELGVDFILEGSVQRAGERIRVTAQLVEGSTGRHLWAERYDRHVNDLFAVMDDVTQMIVGTLATTYGGRIRKAMRERMGRSGPTSFGSFDHFLKGMELLNRFSRDSIPLAIAEFEHAIALEPRYTKAHAKLAWAHMADMLEGYSAAPDVSLAKAREAAIRAVECDDAESWAHWAIAGCAMCGGQIDRAVSGMQRAIELNPNDADVLTDAGYFYSYAGRAQEGLDLALRAMQINPNYPEYYSAQIGQIYFDARRYGDAVEALERLRTIDTALARLYLAASHAALGHSQTAASHIARALELDPSATVTRWTSPDLAPYRDESDLAHLRINLSKAGLPE